MAEEAKKYLNKGYWFSMSMKGLQNELIRVDLTDGKEIIRIMILEGWDKHIQVKVLQVRRYTEWNGWGVLWNDDGELVSETVFKKGEII